MSFSEELCLRCSLPREKHVRPERCNDCGEGHPVLACVPPQDRACDRFESVVPHVGPGDRTSLPVGYDKPVTTAVAYLLMKMKVAIIPTVADVRIFSEQSPSVSLNNEFYCELSRATGNTYEEATEAVADYARVTPWLQWVFQMNGMAGMYRRGR